jgi:hypothetical protein
MNKSAFRIGSIASFVLLAACAGAADTETDDAGGSVTNVGETTAHTVKVRKPKDGADLGLNGGASEKVAEFLVDKVTDSLKGFVGGQIDELVVKSLTDLIFGIDSKSEDALALEAIDEKLAAILDIEQNTNARVNALQGQIALSTAYLAELTINQALIDQTAKIGAHSDSDSPDSLSYYTDTLRSSKVKQQAAPKFVEAVQKLDVASVLQTINDTLIQSQYLDKYARYIGISAKAGQGEIAMQALEARFLSLVSYEVKGMRLMVVANAMDSAMHPERAQANEDELRARRAEWRLKMQLQAKAYMQASAKLEAILGGAVEFNTMDEAGHAHVNEEIQARLGRAVAISHAVAESFDLESERPAHSDAKVYVALMVRGSDTAWKTAAFDHSADNTRGRGRMEESTTLIDTSGTGKYGYFYQDAQKNTHLALSNQWVLHEVVVSLDRDDATQPIPFDHVFATLGDHDITKDFGRITLSPTGFATAGADMRYDGQSSFWNQTWNVSQRQHGTEHDSEFSVLPTNQVQVNHSIATRDRAFHDRWASSDQLATLPVKVDDDLLTAKVWISAARTTHYATHHGDASCNRSRAWSASNYQTTGFWFGNKIAYGDDRGGFSRDCTFAEGQSTTAPGADSDWTWADTQMPFVGKRETFADYVLDGAGSEKSLDIHIQSGASAGDITNDAVEASMQLNALNIYVPGNGM